ncbi:MAG: hypothetical protein JEY97_11495 [Bacteroidales bacterium]|nr:hypothetical protein [Bacteroidales bacterium]
MRKKIKINNALSHHSKPASFNFSLTCSSFSVVCSYFSIACPNFNITNLNFSLTYLDFNVASTNFSLASPNFSLVSPSFSFTSPGFRLFLRLTSNNYSTEKKILSMNYEMSLVPSTTFSNDHFFFRRNSLSL